MEKKLTNCQSVVQSLLIPWQKPPSKRSRQILLPHNASRSDVRPEQFERRARLVSAIARGRRWLDDVVSGRVTTVAELCTRESCSVRQVNMTISLAFIAPNLVKAAVEGCLPRGIGIERLRDPPAEVQSRARSRPPGTEFLDAETKRQKPSTKGANSGRDQNPRTEWPEIPAETPYSASGRKRSVCEDWMVVCAVKYEPVSEAKIADNSEKYRKK